MVWDDLAALLFRHLWRLLSRCGKSAAYSNLENKQRPRGALWQSVAKIMCVIVFELLYSISYDNIGR
jgi:hypothetical protein